MGVWKKEPVPDDALLIGEHVLYCPPASLAESAQRAGILGKGACRGHTEPMIKRVVAGPGDAVWVNHGGVWVNGVLLDNSRPIADVPGALRRIFPGYKHVLSAGEVWLYSDHPRGYDSRYYGTAKRDNIVSVVRPDLVLGP